MRHSIVLTSLFSLVKPAFNANVNCNKTSEVCLNGGSNENEGDVFFEGRPICDDSWDAVAADVVCKQLNFLRAKTATWKSKFGTLHQANYSMDDVRCEGGEGSISDCSFTSNDNCGEGEAAGVVCDNRTKEAIEKIEKECFSYNISHADIMRNKYVIASSAIHCQELCQDDMSCDRFTFLMKTKRCYLLKRDASPRDEIMTTVANSVAGPQKCDVPESSVVLPEDNCNRMNKICLKGGKDFNEGNVFLEGRPVCDDGWNFFTANIVCKELGYSRALNATTRSHFGQVSGNFSMDNVVCLGHEDKLKHCEYSEEDDCDGLEGAGVVCDTTSAEEIKRKEEEITATCFVENYSVATSFEEPSLDGLHLVGGNNSAEGNVFIGDQPVCDDRWHLVDAEVACRQLGFRGAKTYKKSSYFGRVPTNFSMDEIHCQGTETRLQDCQHLNFSDCGAGEGAGVVCDDMMVYALTNSAIECQALCYNQDSCSHFSFERDSSRCFLGNSTAKYYKQGTIMGPSNCEIDMPKLKEEDNCTKEGAVCLRGGSGPHEGNVFIGGNPVCDDGWSTEDADVICQQKGYFRSKSATTNSKFGTVFKQFGINDVNCTGVENEITDCPHNQTNNCHIGEAAGVVCDTANFTLNLRGGSDSHEGNVFLGDSPVCDDQWDFNDTTVVCRQLGFHAYIRPTNSSFFGNVGTSDFAMDNVRCDGSESNLSKCIHRSKDDCDSSEGAGVICDRRTKSEIDEEMKTTEKCFTRGVTYSDKSYINSTRVLSVTLCHELCRATEENCTHFSYSDGTCKLFSSGDKKINASITTVSGPRICLTTPLKACPPGENVCLSGAFLNEGQVVVNGRPVCDDDWNTLNGHVVCKQLGYHKVTAITTKSKYGKVFANYSMDNVRCFGNETSIEECPHSSENNCDAGEAAGVICDTRSPQEIKAEEMKIANECFVRDVSYNVTARFTELALTPMDCQEHCMSRPGCTHFTFEIKSKRCQIYTPGCRSMSGPEIAELLQLGSPVVKGEDWKWGDQDGDGHGVISSLSSSSGSGWVRVRWGHGKTNSYRMGIDGKYDLKFDCSVTGGEFTDNIYLGNHKIEKEGSISGPRSCSGPKNHIVDVAISNTNCQLPGNICLMKDVSNANSHEGNVFVSGKPVCDDDWGMEDANVVCRQLGYPKALRYTVESFFGQVKASYGMDGVNCTGEESGITECAHDMNDNCDGGEAAGVTCDYRTEEDISVEQEKINTCFVENMSYNQTKAFLVMEDVTTVTECQNFLCENCTHFSFSQKQEKCFLYKGLPESKSTLEAISGPRMCENFNMSLVQGSNSSIDCNENSTVCLGGGSNRREGNVFIGGKPVCDDMWTFKEANLVCRQLGYFQAKNYTTKSAFGQVSADFAMDDVACSGKEDSLLDCNHTALANCDGLEAAGVICDSVNETHYKQEETKRMKDCYTQGYSYVHASMDLNSSDRLHLVGGEGPHEGNVFIGDKPVCDDSWDDTDARIVCRQLGLQFVKKTRESKFGEVSSDFAMDNVDCYGSETRLQDCSYDPDDNCGRGEGAGVVCRGSPPNKTEVASVLSCQHLCEKSPNCHYFSFNNQTHECYLAETIEYEHVQKNMISGPKVCIDEENYDEIYEEYYNGDYDHSLLCPDNLFVECKQHNVTNSKLKNITTSTNITNPQPIVTRVKEDSDSVSVAGISGGVVVTLIVILVVVAAVLYKFKARKTGADTSNLIVDRVVYKDSSYVHMDQINYNEETNPGHNEEANPGFGVITESTSSHGDQLNYNEKSNPGFGILNDPAN